MKQLRKRMIQGSLFIIISMASAILGTILYDYLVSNFGHEIRFQIIFGTGGGLMGFAAVVFAFIVWTNNMGSGIKDEKKG